MASIAAVGASDGSCGSAASSGWARRGCSSRSSLVRACPRWRGRYPRELLAFIPLLLVAVAGCVLALFRQRAGGWLQIAGGT